MAPYFVKATNGTFIDLSYYHRFVLDSNGIFVVETYYIISRDDFNGYIDHLKNQSNLKAEKNALLKKQVELLEQVLEVLMYAPGSGTEYNKAKESFNQHVSNA